MLTLNKKSISVVFLFMVLAGCTSVKYRYDISLIHPHNDTMSFEDNGVEFHFVPSAERIQAVIKNTTDHDISLVRNRAEYINPSGKFLNIHYGFNYIQEVRSFSELYRWSVPPITIEPHSELAGFVWINNWPDLSAGYQDRTSIAAYKLSYLMEPLFPRNNLEGNGEDLKGATFKLVLPIDFGGYITPYTFVFRIDNVTQK